VAGRDARRLIVTAVVLLAAGCAPKMTAQQALVEEAFSACRSQGPSTKLERVERDGRFSVVGRETEAQLVHDCMVRYDQAERREARPAATAPGVQPLLAGRLPGIWRGTLTLPPRSAGEAEVAAPATVRFTVVGGTLRWTMATSAGGAPVSAAGSAVVVDGELRMTGAVRPPGRPVPARPVTVRYAGTMVGDRLEVTGVTADRQVHMLSVRRVAE
jgi:hypothetical protein